MLHLCACMLENCVLFELAFIVVPVFLTRQCSPKLSGLVIGTEPHLFEICSLACSRNVACQRIVGLHAMAEITTDVDISCLCACCTGLCCAVQDVLCCAVMCCAYLLQYLVTSLHDCFQLWVCSIYALIVPSHHVYTPVVAASDITCRVSNLYRLS